MAIAKRVECKTQAECDAALKAGNLPILIGDGWFKIESSSHVEAWGSSHVEAWGSSHVEARGSSHVVAWGSSHVVARESSHVEARESSHVEASPLVAIHQHSDHSEISGGVVIMVKAPSTPIEWCDYYGAKHNGEIATLFKAVRDDYRSGHGFLYKPGTSPEAPDWDGGAAECGGGLHFCADPISATGFDSDATRFVACPVALADITVHQNPCYPNKIKARRIVGAIYEVDRYGKRLEEKVKAE